MRSAWRAVEGGMIWTDGYVGLPFREGGRDRAGLDCWGLVRLVLREQTGLTLPRYDGLDDPADAIAEAMRASAWLKVPEAEVFDVVCMLQLVKTQAGYQLAPLHVGVIAGHDRMLHIDRGRTSACVSLKDKTVRHRIHGFYRYQGEGL